MSPKHWGPPTWIFFHTLAEKIQEDKFIHIGHELVGHIISICNNLPCQDCTRHAKEHLSKIDIKGIKTKNDLRNMLYVLHNEVNKLTSKNLFKYENLNNFAKNDLILAFNNFAKNFTAGVSLNSLSFSFHRSRLLPPIRKWIIKNNAYLR